MQTSWHHNHSREEEKFLETIVKGGWLTLAWLFCSWDCGLLGKSRTQFGCIHLPGNEQHHLVAIRCLSPYKRGKVFSPACFLAKTLFVAWHPSRCTNRRASLPLRFANTTYQVVIGHILQQNVSLSSGMTGIQLPGLPQLQQFWEWGTEMRQFICKTESCIASNELKNKQKTTQMWHLLFSNYSCCIFTADEKQTSFSVLSLPACLETQLSLDACRSIFFKRSAFPF